ncbi:MAG: HAMP domain-containing histidine kinase [Pseudomonadales bacterium]|nr:HAMP domain-containing histidine kinase [Pseudomonadales bacterium]MCP5184911.1 HAMP domain-containing histidine kinase [Pseudomonadales bacterium]
MTPEVVIYRYLEVLQHEPVDIPALTRLICTDADLLGRWLTVLSVPADPEVLRQRLSALAPHTIATLARAQAWSMLTSFGAARLALDQWQTTLSAAFLAEAMAREIGLPPARTRSLVLLAMSGVSLPHDRRLRELIEFRGTPLELLRDADTTQQILAIVEATGSDASPTASELAATLLNVAPDAFTRMQGAAEEACARLLRKVAIADDAADDWTERISAEQQLAMLIPLLDGNSTEAVFAVHEQISRCLFERLPSLLLRDADGTLRLLPEKDVRIHVDSTSSGIAQACREGAARAIQDRSQSSVADRIVMRRLGVEDAVVLPLVAQGDAEDNLHGALVFPVDEESEPDYLMHAYATALGHRLGRADATARAPDVSQLDLYREKELQRLREIVHEANNPLSIVNNYLHILELRLHGEVAIQEQLAMMGRELRRASAIFQRVKDLPEPDAPEADVAAPSFQRFDLQALVRNVTELHVGYAQEAGVELEGGMSNATAWVESDEDQIAQVLTNLLKNAIEACRPGDLVTVTVQPDVYRDGIRGVEFSVQDSGPGIETDVLNHLFEPKTSAKGGDHAGLGLVLVNRIVQALGGSIDVRSSAAMGTAFSVFLPGTPTAIT